MHIGRISLILKLRLRGNNDGTGRPERATRRAGALEYRNGENCVLIIDEAQNLSADILESIRVLSNFETSTDKLMQIVLVGQPNVGKSSLLNRLAREEAAIVTAIPGTTRDTIERAIEIGGIPLTVVDAAERVSFSYKAAEVGTRSGKAG